MNNRKNNTISSLRILQLKDVCLYLCVITRATIYVFPVYHLNLFNIYDFFGIYKKRAGNIPRSFHKQIAFLTEKFNPQ